MKVHIEREIYPNMKESYRLETNGCGCCASYREYPTLLYFDEDDTSVSITLGIIEQTIESLEAQLSIANDLKVILKGK